MTLDEAIKYCLEVAEHNEALIKRGYAGGCNSHDCSERAENHRQLAKWLTELKEAKRLLKAAVEDFTAIGEVRAATSPILCPKYYEAYMKAIDVRTRKWRYADEALALLGKDTNVGHKSGGWISVKDRLPEAVEKDVDGKIAFSDFVLVYLVYDDGFTFITVDKCNTDKKGWLTEIPSEGCKVTHWQPLPEPPKDGAENG